MGRAAELRRETDLLEHGLGEIAAADPQPGEADELSRLAARLGHADALELAARTAHHSLLGDPDDPAGEAADVTQLLGTAARALAQLDGTDPELDALARRLHELSSLSAELGADLSAYAEQLDTDPARLQEVETRRVRAGRAGPQVRRRRWFRPTRASTRCWPGPTRPGSGSPRSMSPTTPWPRCGPTGTRPPRPRPSSPAR